MSLSHWILIGTHALIGTVTALHALLNKRDPRAALGWIAVCLAYPFVGPLLYSLLGVNRVRTRARELRRGFHFQLRPHVEQPTPQQHTLGPPRPRVPPELAAIARASDSVTRRPLQGGNAITPLYNGEQAFPAMLDAIEAAKHSLYLATYIFDRGPTGLRFAETLGRAVSRGVDVRVLIDGVGEWYSIPRIGALLKARRVPLARFLPPRLVPPTLHINLRNHRKLLIADGKLGFTGGMNLSDSHLVDNPANRTPVTDLHFRIAGPVVAQMEHVFLEDWAFATGESGATTRPPVPAVGEAICRTITDGPDQDLGKLTTILMSAVSLAQHRIDLITPYFLPSRELVAAFQAAALRGVAVVILLPARSNQPLVHWATRNMLWELLQRGARVYYQPEPFAHTKLLVIDGQYAHIGSANIDPRSLRLNFELTVEVLHRQFAQSMTAYVDRLRACAREVTLAELDGRALPGRVRDALAWLFSPYL